MRVWFKMFPTFVQVRVYMGADLKKTMDKIGTLEIPIVHWPAFQTMMKTAEFMEDF